ncbi:MAG: hypothetical protein KBE22_00485 [Candidatus Accumulibacter sp.]|nr:hypothetical protein [Accumulibacter sp.]
MAPMYHTSICIRVKRCQCQALRQAQVATLGVRLKGDNARTELHHPYF